MGQQQPGPLCILSVAPRGVKKTLRSTLGKVIFQEYLLYFERVSKWNGWSEAEKGSQLGMTVSREARGVISNLPHDLQGNYAAMVNALTKRFNPPGREEMYKTEFRNRVRIPSEKLIDFGYDLTRTHLWQCEN